MNTLEKYTLPTTSQYQKIEKIIDNELEENFKSFLINISDDNIKQHKQSIIDRFSKTDFYKKNFFIRQHKHLSTGHYTEDIQLPEHDFNTLGKKLSEKLDEILNNFIVEKFTKKTNQEINNIF